MSKKSRKRNKKILAALALAGGAALMAKRGRGEISSNRPSGIDAASVVKSIGPRPVNTGSAVDRARVEAGKFINKINDPTTAESGMQFITPTSERDLDFIRGNAVPPSMRGGAKRAQGWAPRALPASPIIKQYKKGGRVTGIAKRGFGRALMKGKK
jgi:hypothetical protein